LKTHSLILRRALNNIGTHKSQHKSTTVTTKLMLFEPSIHDQSSDDSIKCQLTNTGMLMFVMDDRQGKGYLTTKKCPYMFFSPLCLTTPESSLLSI
ncbi:hypothetical protein M8C21_015472, partial [Ambrosia artemisiifolia]